MMEEEQEREELYTRIEIEYCEEKGIDRDEMTTTDTLAIQELFNKALSEL